ncbi:MAG: hypothetical protein COU63_04495 [Candidatus Pacebacteria bacterium CG10_big_fil_rev_8_21_14_0_10_36_11]|nr:hypothetical protein [Candidatus Pacearchaeota archaeon]OIP74030.1 MAG: hypothetical protein AUK08_02120 [Candidatus Pacebacteria bacterium CG2_30_36_39]PIR64328.1 MAG: hypothetical protein COU63_04495 [Candidatus Pacebacteria bacterium CG10_big_fil_rev_8_21_14_0_10_36_11]PJC42545.1 MAG: hypothetical protein CO040_03915 [Candidatus Pacebacteria bacterium CG_4_9_14_0_2_um_filter_36_8]
MSETPTYYPEPIQPKKATLADRVITWMVDHWQKNKPDIKAFVGRKNEITTDNGDDLIVAEENLPVIAEATELMKARQAEGKLINKETNPLGENVKDLTMMIFGDPHIPGSELEDSPYELNQPYRLIKKIRAIFLGFKPTKDVDRDGATETFNAFQALKQSFVNHLQTSSREGSFTNDSKILITNVGDSGNTEHKMGDNAFAALQLEGMRADLADAAERRETVMMHAQGNHDSDLNNHGLEHDWFHRELYGSQVFLQEIGDDVVVLSINTNFYSTFWHQHLERRKQGGLNEREEKALALIRQEMEKQKLLIEKAKQSGKRIVLVGHERGYLEQAMGGNLAETSVVAVVSGHTHKHENIADKKKQNLNHEVIKYLNVGANKKAKVDGVSKSVLSGFSLRIRDDENGLQIKIDEIIPTEVDYQTALSSM